MNGRVHIVGAGLAGLSAAVRLAAEGAAVALYEAGPQAGGRCRSYFDSELGCRIDNGNHLLLAGNRAALLYVGEIGARATVTGPPAAEFAFVDMESGRRWTLRPNRTRVPWWIFSPARRIPQTRARDYLAVLGLRGAGPEASVAQALDRHGTVFRRLWAPLAVAALNTGVEEASARLFWRILVETLGRGGAACRPLLPREGLSESLVDPALARLRACRAEIRFGARVRRLGFAADRVRELAFDGDAIPLGAGDQVVLAVPASVAARLVPDLVVPDAFAPIVNAHFRAVPRPGMPPFIGVIGGAAEWIFRKREVLSVTVSAADRFVDRPAEELRALFWHDVAFAYGLARQPVPPARIVKERRATFLASPEQLRRRPPATTRWKNLLLAGDYVDTGLPGTIEGAIRSGFAAAQFARDRRHGGTLRVAAFPGRSPAAITVEEQREQCVLP
ncbi:MAG TPA: hydroxysqualene dehydroxylase HpnE [Stellaceae bacterium]|nr:hydroxysqualene dehydroxylase HpnE [Stellaceae bacterium]